MTRFKGSTALMYPSRASFPYKAPEASVTNLTHRSTPWEWQGMRSTRGFSAKLSTCSSGRCLVIGGSILSSCTAGRRSFKCCAFCEIFGTRNSLMCGGCTAEFSLIVLMISIAVSRLSWSVSASIASRTFSGWAQYAFRWTTGHTTAVIEDGNF